MAKQLLIPLTARTSHHQKSIGPILQGFGIDHKHAPLQVALIYVPNVLGTWGRSQPLHDMAMQNPRGVKHAESETLLAKAENK